jgi:hypothetical protein
MNLTRLVEEAEVVPHGNLLALHYPAAAAVEAVAEHHHLPVAAHNSGVGILLQAAGRQRSHRCSQASQLDLASCRSQGMSALRPRRWENLLGRRPPLLAVGTVP